MLNPIKRAELHFENRQEIGQEGSNSKVHVAFDHQLNDELVVKTVSKATLADPNEYFQEARILYLGRHPNVVPLHWAAQDNDNIYVSMPYFRNGSLNARLNKERLTVREIVRYATQIATGVHNIHAKRLVHFDVKPDNVLLSDRDEAMVSDFGLAKQTDARGLAGQDRWYLKMRPPEAWHGHDFDRRFDIYQVGLTLYRMTYGNKAFYDQFATYGDKANFDRDRFRHDVTNGQFPDRTLQEEHVPSRLRDVINKCLHTDPMQRYGSVVDVINELAQIEGEELDWRPVDPGQGQRKWQKLTDDYEYEFVIDADGKSIAQRRRPGAGFRRIAGYCLDAPTTQQIRRFFRSN